jgi:sulfate permease, SulP family
MSRLGRWVPIIDVLQGYQLAWMRADLIAGASVCVVMIPAVIAYAELAGLPPKHGLYAALGAMTGYALFCSSRHVIAGPDGAVALLVATVIGPLVVGDPTRAVPLAGLTALLGGLLMLLAAALRIGAVADFLSKPVLVGYMSGAALILASTQLGKLFGIKLNSQTFFPMLRELVGHLGETHRLTFALGAAFIVLLELLHWFAPKMSGALVVCIVALGASLLFNLPSHGVKVIGEVTQGLPRPVLPVASLAEVRVLLPGALAIALLTFPDGILLARAFAAKQGYVIRPNQELVALAAANLVSGSLQGFSVGASQSRTVINEATGGKTSIVNLFAAALLCAFLFVLTPVLRPLPTVALAAILISAGIHLIEVREYRAFLRINRRAALVALVVGVGVLIVGMIPGILIGVGLSLIYVLAHLARPHDAVLHEVPGTGSFHDLGENLESQTVPGLIAYRFYAPLFFANAEYFVRRIQTLVANSTEPVKWVLVDVQAVSEIDVTGADAIQRLARDLDARGISLKFARANRPLREVFDRIGLGDRLRDERLFPSVHVAIQTFRQQESLRAVADDHHVNDRTNLT